MTESTQDIQADLDRALTLHQAGRIRDAVHGYLQLLPRKPADAQLLYLLGTALLQDGQLGPGCDFLRQSVALDGRNAAAFNNLGIALKDLGRLDEAVANFHRAIGLKPEYVEAHSNLAVALQDLGRPHDALASLDQAIALKPDHAQAHNNRGIALERLQRTPEALSSYDRAIALKPDFADAFNNRGNALQNLGRPEEALASFDRAIALEPNRAEAHCNRGLVLMKFGELEPALASFDRAISIRPDYGPAHNHRAGALKAMQRLDEALASYDRALALQPDAPDAHNNRGNAFQQALRLDEALASYDQAIFLKPDYVEAYSNRGGALRELNLPEAALASYDRAIALDPAHADAYWNKSLLLILLGRYAEGWTLYEWRLRKPDLGAARRDFPQPAWRGTADIAGQRLFVHSEQGLGDAIQFCRYLPALRALGADILFEVPAALVSLVSTLRCEMTVIARGGPAPGADAQCPLMSLPHVFGTTLETVPADVPYLFARPEHVRRWESRLGRRDRFRIGLAWSGSATHRNDANRSLRLEQLLPLIDDQAEWHSLQKDYRVPDLRTLNLHPGIHQHQDDLADLAETAALIECMDLVITVDTAVAHLAGAMGKPVWIMLPHSPDYRWMLERSDSPWYPTARLVRQTRRGDWSGVVETLRAQLAAAIGA